MTLKIRNIGIPRAFYFHIYPALFETFFSALEIETVVSPPSNKKTLRLAANVCEAEHCLPNKLFDGHVASVAEAVDAVFVPRMISLTKGYIACPRFGALPEATRAWLGDDTPVISMEINETKGSLKKRLVELALQLGANKKLAKHSAQAAIRATHKAQKEIKKNNSVRYKSGETGRFLVLGHPYTLHDAFIGTPILRKLKKLNVPVEVFSFDEKLFGPGEILWCTFAKMFDALCRLDKSVYAGVIQITTFNCGTDSMMMERFRRLCKKRGVPYMILMVDEHTGQAGIETRIEAFTDSILWSGRLQRNLR